MDMAELEAFYDAVPRQHGTAEEVGPFTVFLGEPGGWPLYARPRLGGGGPFTAAAVREVLDRMRELEVPLAIEWVHDVTPGLVDAVREDATLEVTELPLLVLQEDIAPPEVDEAVVVRMLGPATRSTCWSRSAASRSWHSARRRIRPPGVAEREGAAKPPNDTTRALLRSGEAADRRRRAPRAWHPGRRPPPVGRRRDRDRGRGDAARRAGSPARVGGHESARGGRPGARDRHDLPHRGVRTGRRDLRPSGLPPGRHGVRRGAAEHLRCAPQVVTDPEALVVLATDARGRFPGHDPCETAMQLPHHRRSRSLGDHLLRGLARAFAAGIGLEAFILAAAGMPSTHTDSGATTWSRVDQARPRSCD